MLSLDPSPPQLTEDNCVVWLTLNFESKNFIDYLLKPIIKNYLLSTCIHLVSKISAKQEA